MDKLLSNVSFKVKHLDEMVEAIKKLREHTIKVKHLNEVLEDIKKLRKETIKDSFLKCDTADNEITIIVEGKSRRAQALDNLLAKYYDEKCQELLKLYY